MIEAVSHCKFLVSKEHAISLPKAQLSKKNFPFWKGKKNENHSTKCSQDYLAKFIVGNYIIHLIILFLDRQISVKGWDLLKWVIILKYLPIIAQKTL